MLNPYNISYPKVSIIIPVYNGSNYLAHAIECALNQTYDNIEVIVVNDGSADEGRTETVAQSYGNKIQYYYKENGGVSSALNYGIKKMTGDYFSWLSHDDGYSESKIKDSIELLRRTGRLGERCIAFTGGIYINSEGGKIKAFRSYFEENNIYPGKQVVEIMTQKGTLNGCCMLIPKSAFDEVGTFEESLRYSQDSLMWYRIFLSGYELVSDNKENVFYRIHRKQTSQTRRDLYEHDIAYIAKNLAQPLTEIDSTHTILYQYIKRITRNQCKQALDFLMEYSIEHKLFSKKQMLKLRIDRFKGAIRYSFVRYTKNVLFKFKSK